MTFSKFAVISLIAVALIMTGTQPGRAAATTTSSEDQVTVCHFPGHHGDFVTFNSEPSGTPECDRRGGNAITNLGGSLRERSSRRADFPKSHLRGRKPAALGGFTSARWPGGPSRYIHA